MKDEYSLERLRKEVKEEFEKDGDVIVTEVDDETLEIHLKSDKDISSRMYLGNMIKEINMGYNPDDVIKRRMEPFALIKQAKETEKNMENWEWVKDKLVFVLQHKDYEKGALKKIKGELKEDEKKDEKIEDNSFYTKPFINDIVLMGVIDFPGYISYITKRYVKSWNKTDEEIETQIIKNLAEYKSKYSVDTIGGFFEIFAHGGGILSTFLIQPKKLREIADKNGLKGKELLGAIPFRDLIILSENSLDKAMRLWQAVNAMMADDYMPYPLSSQLFMIDKEGVISQYKTDEIPGEGVVVGLDKKRGKIITMPIGRKEISMDGPTAEELEERFKTDKRLQKGLILMGMMEDMMKKIKDGLPAEEFLKFLLDNGHTKEECTEIIKGLLDEGLMKIEEIDGNFKLYPTEEVMMRLLNKFKGKLGGK